MEKDDYAPVVPPPATRTPRRGRRVTRPAATFARRPNTLPTISE